MRVIARVGARPYHWDRHRRTSPLPFAALNDALIHYADEGPRDGSTVLMFDALGTDFRIWDAVAAALARRFRVVRMDKRGHGLSTAENPKPQMADYALDAAALLDRLDIKRALVAGVSMGGQIAQELHRLRPDLVAALLLSGTAVKIGNDESWDARIGAIQSGGLASVADAILRRWFSGAFRENRRAELEGYRTMLINQPQVGYLAACRAIRGADLRAHAGRIRVPTQCIVGDEDGSTPPALVKETGGLIAHAGFTLIPGAGHLPCIERPDVVAAAVIDLAARAQL